MTVDPKVYALAESFVEDMLEELGKDPLDPTKRAHKRELVQRAAEAMQQAIEDECKALRQELTK